jgi:ParB-like chromosome segregation protein Spo0J
VRRLGEEAFDGFFMRTSKTKKTRGAGSAAAGRADGENIPAGNSIAPGTSPEVVTIHRRQINAAPYNPRKIGEKNRGKLRKGMLEFGMVELLVWNKRSGNLVGGHQRLSILDEENGSDYTLQVSQVDLDAKQERKLNLLLNNAKAQGKWDDDKLTALIASLDGDLDLTGFDPEDFAATIAEAEQLKASWQILIECQNEAEQAALLEKLTAEGLTCKALTA